MRIKVGKWKMFKQTSNKINLYSLLKLFKNTQVNIISGFLNYKIPWAEAMHFRILMPNCFYFKALTQQKYKFSLT